MTTRPLLIAFINMKRRISEQRAKVLQWAMSEMTHSLIINVSQTPERENAPLEMS